MSIAPTVRLFQITLFPHDPLWFSSVEISGQVVTEPIFHPYALTFAMAGGGRVYGREDRPDYDQDLPPDVYCLAGEGSGLQRIRLSYNAVDAMTLRTDRNPNLNTPRMGSRLCIEPNVLLGIRAYVFTRDGSAPRRVVRLGKKRAALRVEWNEILPFSPQRSTTAVTLSHPLNPLDLVGRVESFVPVNMAPHLLLREAAVCDDWIVRWQQQAIHLPRRVQAWLNLL